MTAPDPGGFVIGASVTVLASIGVALLDRSAHWEGV